MNFKFLKMFGTQCFTSNSSSRFILLAIFITLSSVSFYGQQVVSENDLKDSAPLLNKSGFDTSRLNSLLQDVQPAAYFQNGKLEYYGETNAVVLFIDAAQISTISSQIKKLSSIELVKIYLKGGNPGMINQEALNELPSLKYVFFVCDSCGESNMTNMLSARKTFSDKILVLHTSEKNN